jgi:glucose/arabinose dehydrogenase
VGDGSLLYAVIGDLNRTGQLQNVPGGAAPDDTSVILRVRQDGTPAPGNPFHPYCSIATTTQCDDDGDCPGGQVCRKQNLRYYAYGVRNSFGLALDPVTGSLWDTENGVFDYDEINRVTPGMNSGWGPIMGPDARDPNGVGDLFHMPAAGITYSDPEFSWLQAIAPAAIVFPHGSSLGEAYDDTVIVGDINPQQLYALPLNAARTGFALAGIPGLADGVADSVAERDLFRIGTGFPATDLEIGPDGNLYVVRIAPGSIYRIVGPREVPALPPWAPVLLAAALAAGAWRAVRAARRRD